MTVPVSILLAFAGLFVSARVRLAAVIFGQPVSVPLLGLVAVVLVLVLAVLVLWLLRLLLRDGLRLAARDGDHVTGDRAIRWTAVLAVLAVAGVAGYVSYFHAVEVVTSNGEPGIIARLYPASIDGLIIAASAVLLDAARHGEDAPALAWWLLGSGIAVTLAANITYGARHGIGGALWSAWPALAFVGCYELLLLLARASARRSGRERNALSIVALPSAAEAAAEASLRATLAAGNPWSVNALVTQFRLTRPEATKLRTRVLAEANGHDPENGVPPLIPDTP